MMRFLTYLLLSLTLLISPNAAAQTPQQTGSETERCVGWAVPGAVAGLALGFGLAAGGYALADRPIGSSAADVAIILASESLGMTLGPIATCAAFGQEPYLIPAASFAIGGGLLGGTALGVPAVLLMNHLLRDNPHGDYVPAPYPLMVITAISAGVIAGGWAGLKLERHLRADAATLTLIPSPQGPTLALLGRF